MRERLPLVIVAVGGAFASFWRLATAGWGVDEVTYTEAGEAYLAGDFSLNRGHAWFAKELIGASVKLFGRNEIAVRTPGALLGFLTGFLIYALVRRLGGTSLASVASAGIWWLLPQAPGVHLIRLDRYGMLEPPMMFFAVAALLSAWMWSERRTWPWAVVAAACLGLSASSKFTGALFAPAVALPYLWVAMPIRRRLAHAALAGLAGLAGLVLPYLAGGLDGIGALGEGVALQFDNNSAGHLQIVAGTIYSDPPWWSHLWWQAQYLTWPAVATLWALAALGLAAACGGASAPSAWRVRIFLLVAFAFPAISLVISTRKLPHYHLVLLPLLAVTAGLGLAAVLRTRPGRFAAAPLVVVLAAVAAMNLFRVATLEPDAYRIAAGRLEEAGLAESEVLVFGWGHVLEAEMPEVRALTAPPAARPVAIVVDPVTRDRFRGGELDLYIASVAGGYDRTRAGRLTLYVLRP